MEKGFYGFENMRWIAVHFEDLLQVTQMGVLAYFLYETVRLNAVIQSLGG